MQYCINILCNSNILYLIILKKKKKFPETITTITKLGCTFEYVQKEIDVTNFTSLSDNIDATEFSVFLTFELRVIILF